MADTVELLVGGFRYEGWKSVRITRSIESIAGSFALDVYDRWGDGPVWPITEEDSARVTIGGETVIDGYVDRRSITAQGTSRSLSFSGRDRAGALVDCSAIAELGTEAKKKWTFYNTDVVALAKEIAAPFDIAVSVQPGLASTIAKNKKVVVQPGDTCFEVISKVAAAAGVLVISDGKGGIVVTRGGTERAATLVEGENIHTCSVEYDASDRFHVYYISSQLPGTDEASGEATRIQAQAIDDSVRRTNRVTLIRPDKGYSVEDSKRRADWEARIRAAKAERVSVGVRGWRQPGGRLWSINTLARVKAPVLLGVNGDMLISQVEFSIGDGGQMTTLSLVRPDAFTPEPTATVKGSSGGQWKEWDKGAKFDARLEAKKLIKKIMGD